MRASRKQVLLVVGAMVATFAAAPASAQIVDNGSFEVPDITAPFTTVTGNTITGWEIGGNVDLIGSYWVAADGSQSVDLNGTQLGSLSQSVELTAGQAYTLSFAMSGNPDGPPDPKTLAVSISNTTLLAAASREKPANSSMNWLEFSFDFIALAGSSYDLLFQSTSVGGGGFGACLVGQECYGPALDNVSITLIPEPETYAMLIAGIGLLGFMARRRKLALGRFAV